MRTGKAEFKMGGVTLMIGCHLRTVISITPYGSYLCKEGCREGCRIAAINCNIKIDSYMY